MQISGTTALVTGASGGVGSAVSRRLAREGARLILTGRREQELSALARECGAEVVVADLATAEGVAAVADVCGDVDIAVHNAGIPAAGKLADFDDEHLDRALAVNLRAPIALSRALVKGMAARGKGHLVLVSSVSGKIGMADMSIYSATKFGLRGFGLALRAELASAGIGVSTLNLGPVSDAGIFADSGLKAPRLFGTSPPEAVADALVRAVEKDVAEIDVAPLPVRASSLVGLVAPQMLQRSMKLVGLGDFSHKLAAATADRR